MELHNYFFINGKHIPNVMLSDRVLFAFTNGTFYNRAIAVSSSRNEVNNKGNVEGIFLVKNSEILSYNADITKGALYIAMRIVIHDGEIPVGSQIGSVGISDGTKTMYNQAITEEIMTYNGGELICDSMIVLALETERIRLTRGDNMFIRTVFGLENSDMLKYTFVADGEKYPATFVHGVFSSHLASGNFKKVHLEISGKKVFELEGGNEVSLQYPLTERVRINGDFSSAKIVESDGGYSRDCPIYFSEPEEFYCKFTDSIMSSDKIDICGEYILSFENGKFYAYNVTEQGVVTLDTTCLASNFDRFIIRADGEIMLCFGKTVFSYKLNGKVYEPLITQSFDFAEEIHFSSGIRALIIKKQNADGYDILEYGERIDGYFTQLDSFNFKDPTIITGSGSSARLYIDRKGGGSKLIVGAGFIINISKDVEGIIYGSSNITLCDECVIVSTPTLKIYNLRTGEKMFEADGVGHYSAKYVLCGGDTLYVDDESKLIENVGHVNLQEKVVSVKVCGPIMFIRLASGKNVCFRFTDKNVSSGAIAGSNLVVTEKMVSGEDMEVTLSV